MGEGGGPPFSEALDFAVDGCAVEAASKTAITGHLLAYIIGTPILRFGSISSCRGPDRCLCM